MTTKAKTSIFEDRTTDMNHSDEDSEDIGKPMMSLGFYTTAMMFKQAAAMGGEIGLLLLFYYYLVCTASARTITTNSSRVVDEVPSTVTAEIANNMLYRKK